MVKILITWPVWLENTPQSEMSANEAMECYIYHKSFTLLFNNNTHLYLSMECVHCVTVLCLLCRSVIWCKILRHGVSLIENINNFHHLNFSLPYSVIWLQPYIHFLIKYYSVVMHLILYCCTISVYVYNHWTRSSYMW